MKLCLVSAPTATEFEDPRLAESDAIRTIAEHAPLGILSLAAVLEEQGLVPTILDLNQLYYEWLRGPSEVRQEFDFCAYASRHLARHDSEVFGFSTICSSYPLTLRIATALRQARPEATVVLGGPQASVVDVATMTAFPAVDFVVRGEAEATFPALLQQLAEGRRGCDIPGITYRRNGRVERNGNAPPIADLDSLPFPAFHLYPNMSSCSYLPLELGRGCPFACSFCSTNDFFRRQFRLKSPQRLLADMRRVKSTYGLDNFDLVHDMFTVDRRKVATFCRAILDSGERFYWGCSARTDCIDEALIRLMHRAGCRGIFFGIETGSERMQKIIKKGLDLAESRRVIEFSSRLGIKTAVSLITGFPEETMEDFRATAAFFMDSLRFDFADPQLCLLAPLAETPIETQHRGRLVFDDVISDMSFQGWRQDLADRDLIAEHPDIFANFYSVPTPELDRHFIREFREFVLVGASVFRWLLVGLHQMRGDLVEVFTAWRTWRQENEGTLSGGSVAEYYSHVHFRRAFLSFVRSRYSSAAGAGAVIELLANYEEALLQPGEDQSVAQPGAGPRAAPGDALIASDMIPVVAPGVRVLRLAGDYKRVVRCLKKGKAIGRVGSREVTVIARAREDGDAEVLQLSKLSAELLRLCDGGRKVADVADGFSRLVSDVRGIPGERACIVGLELLRRQGLVVILSEGAAA
ncbi:MAG TPA: radical SAM protein [Thermoanaerobaculia bacterium]|nr:radical SAM protein [Thermoanaerobaculia bacterium]